eukprot:6591014-Pyramimonas_sp.AAC.1
MQGPPLPTALASVILIVLVRMQSSLSPTKAPNEAWNYTLVRLAPGVASRFAEQPLERTPVQLADLTSCHTAETPDVRGSRRCFTHEVAHKTRTKLKRRVPG